MSPAVIRRVVRRITCSTIVLLAIPAQAAVLEGRVQSLDAEPIPNAMVTMRHGALEKSVTVYSDAEGHYRMPPEDAGLYDLRIRRIGHAPVTEVAMAIERDDGVSREVLALADAWRRNIPLGRAGTPEEVASLATFLASGHAAYITGAVMVVDGGPGASNGQPNIPAILAGVGS